MLFFAGVSPRLAHHLIRLHQRPLRDCQAELIGGFQIDSVAAKKKRRSLWRKSFSGSSKKNCDTHRDAAPQARINADIPEKRSNCRQKIAKLKLSIRGAGFSWLSRLGGFCWFGLARRALLLQPDRFGVQPVLNFIALRAAGLLPKPVG
jgi:hypothetical protein